MGLVVIHVKCEKDAESSVMPFSEKVLPFTIVKCKFVIPICYLQFNFINCIQIFSKFPDIYAVLDLSMLIDILFV